VKFPQFKPLGRKVQGLDFCKPFSKLTTVEDVIYKCIVFIENGDTLNGQFFYNGAHDSDYGRIFGVKSLTLPKAIAILKAKGLDPIKNFKVNILGYYY
jgi:hypothetical protein